MPLYRDGGELVMIVDRPVINTCGICGKEMWYQSCPTGGWWIHFMHPEDEHDAVFKPDISAIQLERLEEMLRDMGIDEDEVTEEALRVYTWAAERGRELRDSRYGG